MGLEEYRRKRNFRVTPEPSGKVRRKSGWSFVVQKHEASQLHYDVRLEFGGVLKSWAVPKGPSLNPADKRLAMPTEDHPVEYADFEGIIPEGEYGGGTILIWDRGHWEPESDPEEGYRQGKLKFRLEGQKLHGLWNLVRAGGKDKGGRSPWFLIKGRDDDARGSDDEPITGKLPKSVVTGRDLEQVAKGAKPRRVRRATPTANRKRAAPRRDAKKDSASSAKLPDFVSPQLATLAKEAPPGDEWLHEIKFDGYRMLCRIEGGAARLISRNALDWTHRAPGVAQAAVKLRLKEGLLDGEVVAMAPDGTTSFQSLQNAENEGRIGSLLYCVFDLLYLDGEDLRGWPLEDRKRRLKKLLGVSKSGLIRYTDHVAGGGEKVFKSACPLGLEGIISKRRDRPFVPGRGYDWLKVKCVKAEEFVIGGYTAPSGSRTGFGALLLGYYEGDRLLYAGKVGTGFNQKSLDELGPRLKAINQAASPFADLKGQTGKARGAQWVKPHLVAQVEFSEWTRDGLLRHPSFQGLREDKPSRDVVRDKPRSLKEVAKKKPVLAD